MLALRHSLLNGSLRSVTSVALLSATLLGPAIAGAQERQAGSRVQSSEEPARRQAKERYREGVEAYEAGLYQLSIEYFAEADRLAPSPALSFNIARAYEKLGKSSRAVTAYREFLQRDPDSENAVLAKERIAALEPRKKTSSDAADAEPAEAAKGVDDITTERAPASFAQLSSASAQLSPGQPGAEKPGLGAWPIVALSAGGAALVTAGVFELLRRDAEGEVNQARRDPDRSQVEIEALNGAAESRQSAAQLSFGVGAALLVTGGVLLLVDERLSRTPTTSAGLAVGPGRFAANMTTRF